MANERRRGGGGVEEGPAPGWGGGAGRRFAVAFMMIRIPYYVFITGPGRARRLRAVSLLVLYLGGKSYTGSNFHDLTSSDAPVRHGVHAPVFVARSDGSSRG